MLDYVLDVEIYASIYPMISLVSKDDKIYAKRGIYYSTFYYRPRLLQSNKRRANFRLIYT